MRAIAALSAFALGCASAVSGFSIFFVTPYSMLFPSILVPGGTLALGSFIAVRWTGSHRSPARALVALIPALVLPIGMGSLMMLRGESMSVWPVVGVAACLISWAAGRVALLVSQAP